MNGKRAKKLRKLSKQLTTDNNQFEMDKLYKQLKKIHNKVKQK